MILKSLARCIDHLNGLVYKCLKWAICILIVIAGWNVLARYIDSHFSSSIGMQLSSNAFLEAQWYLFSIVFMLGAPQLLKNGEHVRVDILYQHLSAQARTWVNLIGHIVFLIPFCAYTLYVSHDWVLNSWNVLENSPDPGGLPRYPIKTLIPLALVLLLAQALSESIKCIGQIRTNTEASKT